MPDIAEHLLEIFEPQREDEICGLVTSTGELIEISNIHEDPMRGFRMDPRELLDTMETHEIVGTYHSHPNSDPNLSQEDYAGFLNWPDLKHYIVGIREGTPRVTSYVVEDGLVMVK